MKDNNFNTIPQKFYDNLPEVIQDACNLFEGHSKDVFLLSLLVAYGSSFSNVYFNYRGDRIYPNLFLAIYSRAGSGKSSMKWIRNVFDEVNEKEITDSLNENPDDGENIDRRTFFIAPNITGAAWNIQLAMNRNHQGLILSTEIDSITKSSSAKEMGGFSDDLRKVAEGETLEVMRKTNKEHLIVKIPKSGLLISGTPNQIVSFIPTAEDGLASRMLYYSFKGSIVWDEFTFDENFDINLELSPLKTHVNQLYDYLTKQDQIIVRFSKFQMNLFNLQFDDWTMDCERTFGDEGIPFVFRLAPRLLKIAAILTIMKINPLNKNNLNTIECDEIDFRQSLAIGELLLEKSMLFLKMLKKNQVQSKYYGQKFDLLMQLPEAFVTSEFLKTALDLNIRKRTAEALLARFADESLVYKVKKGHYKNLFNQNKTDQNEE